METALHIIQAISLAVVAVAGILVARAITPLLKEQLASKQAEIDTLKARIQHLEGMTAPALAEQLHKLAPLIDEYAKKNRDQEAEIKKLGQTATEDLRQSNRLGIAVGLLEGIGALSTIGLSLQPEYYPPVETALMNAVKSLAATMSTALAGTTPELPNSRAFIHLVTSSPDPMSRLIPDSLKPLKGPVDK